MSNQTTLDSMVLTPEQIKSLVEKGEQSLKDDELLLDIIAESGAGFKDATPIDKMLYAIHTAYVKGYMVALFTSNEAIKQTINNMRGDKA